MLADPASAAGALYRASFAEFPLKGQQEAEYLMDCTHAKAGGVLQLDFQGILEA